MVDSAGRNSSATNRINKRLNSVVEKFADRGLAEDSSYLILDVR